VSLLVPCLVVKSAQQCLQRTGEIRARLSRSVWPTQSPGPPAAEAGVGWLNGQMMKTVYENPKYYEIAFSFRDIGAEVDTFERCFKEYAELPVKSILEIGCGPCPHLEELLQRGYVYTGLIKTK